MPKKDKKKSDVEVVASAEKKIQHLKMDAQKLEHLKKRVKQLQDKDNTAQVPDPHLKVGNTVLDVIKLDRSAVISTVNAEILRLGKKVREQRNKLKNAGLIKE